LLNYSTQFTTRYLVFKCSCCRYIQRFIIEFVF